MAAAVQLADVDGVQREPVGVLAEDACHGVTDLEARDAVKLFVGFGGVVKRDRVAAEADVYISANSLAPIVPLVLSPEDARQLRNSGYAAVLRRGLQLIEQQQVHFHIR